MRFALVVLLGGGLVAACGGGSAVPVAEATAIPSATPTSTPAPTPVPATPSPSPTPFRVSVTSAADLERGFIGLPAAQVEQLVQASIAAGRTKVPLPFDPHGISFTIRETKFFTTTAIGFEVPSGTVVWSIVSGIRCGIAGRDKNGEGTNGYRTGKGPNCDPQYVRLDVYGSRATPATDVNIGQEDRLNPIPIGTPVLRATKPIPNADVSVLVWVGPVGGDADPAPMILTDLLRSGDKIVYILK